MSKIFSFLSPLATLILTFYALVPLILLPPLWFLLAILMLVVFFINYRGIRFVLGHQKKNKRWHHYFNIAECLIAVALSYVILSGQSAEPVTTSESIEQHP